jgi:Ca2+/H+ antiporter
MPWIFGLIVVIIVVGGIKWLTSLRKKPFQFHLKKRIKANISSLSILILLVSIVVIFYLPDAYEKYNILSFCIGLIAIGLYFLTRKKS